MAMSSAAMKASLFVLVVSCILICRSRAADPLLVFAHYMLYANNNINVLKQEIRLAQSRGTDVFALNSNVWRQNLAANMYEAAKEVGPSFRIFFSADIHKDENGNLTPDQLVIMLTRYATHPNQMTYRSKPLFTSWLGSFDSWWAEYSYTSAISGWNAVFQKAGGRDRFFFIPFSPTNGSFGAVQGTLEKFKDIMDGLFAWETSAWSYFSPDFQDPSDSEDRNYLSACKAAGKVYMASPSTWFFKNIGSSCCSDACKAKDMSNCNCQVKGNYQGPGLWVKKVREAHTAKPPSPRNRYVKRLRREHLRGTSTQRRRC